MASSQRHFQAFYDTSKKYAQSIDKPFLNLHNEERLNKETRKATCQSVNFKRFLNQISKQEIWVRSSIG